MQGSDEGMIFLGNVRKKNLIYLYVVQQSQKICHLCSHICVKNPRSALWRFWHELKYVVLTAMKQGDEALMLHRLNFSKALNASMLRIFTLHLTLHHCYFLKENNNSTLHRVTFVQKFIAITVESNFAHLWQLAENTFTFNADNIPAFSIGIRFCNLKQQ